MDGNKTDAEDGKEERKKTVMGRVDEEEKKE